MPGQLAVHQHQIPFLTGRGHDGGLAILGKLWHHADFLQEEIDDLPVYGVVLDDEHLAPSDGVTNFGASAGRAAADEASGAAGRGGRAEGRRDPACSTPG